MTGQEIYEKYMDFFGLDTPWSYLEAWDRKRWEEFAWAIYETEEEYA